VTSYEQWLVEQSPGWLQGPYGAGYVGTLGLTKDTVVDAVKQAIKARFIKLAPNDALGYIGDDRVIERYPVDTDATYRARLVAAWETWLYAGTDRGVIAAMNAAGFANVQIFNNLVGPGFEMTWPPDSDAANWSRFWVVITDPQWTGVAWGDGHKWGDPWSWGTTATAADAAWIRAIIRKWKSSHTICKEILIRTSSPAATIARWPG
jgi:hypothetical protein